MRPRGELVIAVFTLMLGARAASADDGREHYVLDYSHAATAAEMESPSCGPVADKALERYRSLDISYRPSDETARVNEATWDLLMLAGIPVAGLPLGDGRGLAVILRHDGDSATVLLSFVHDDGKHVCMDGRWFVGKYESARSP